MQYDMIGLCTISETRYLNRDKITLQIYNHVWCLHKHEYPFSVSYVKCALRNTNKYVNITRNIPVDN